MLYRVSEFLFSSREIAGHGRCGLKPIVLQQWRFADFMFAFYVIGQINFSCLYSEKIHIPGCSLRIEL